jgi:ABC-2 type transport system permease protein
MGRTVTLALKDLTLLRREKAALFWIFVFPLVFALFFGFLSGGGGGARGRLSLAVVDEDESAGSRALLRLAQRVEDRSADGGPLAVDEARDAVRRGDLTAFLVIPKGYGQAAEAFWQEGAALEVGIDPARKAEAGLLEGVLTEAVYAGVREQFADPKAARASAAKALRALDQAPGIDPQQKDALRSFLGGLEQFLDQAGPDGMRHSPFARADRITKVPVLPDEAGRPRSAFELTFPSAVSWGMYGCIITFALSVVAERTKGTLVRLRMSPLSWAEIVAGKGLSCFLVSAFAGVALMALGRLLFGVRVGSPAGLAAAVVAAAFCYTGLMMALAAIGRTERVVSGAAAAVFLPLAMIGGGMIPLFFLPGWMRTVSNVSPVKWTIQALEGAVWRGYSPADMLVPCGVLVGIGLAGFGLGVNLLARQVD